MSLNIFLLLSLTSIALAQTSWTLGYTYDDCSNKNIIGFVAAQSDDNCTAQACLCVGGTCTEILCDQTDVPRTLANAVIFETYDGSNDCDGDPEMIIASTSGTCFSTPSVGGQSEGSFKGTCGSTLSIEGYNVANCEGDPEFSQNVPSFSGSVCAPTGSDGSVRYICTNPACIHVDTKFTYKGNKHDFENIPEECTIPHVVTRDGVKITSSCPGELRLTHEHLVMTPEGWKEAGSIKVGDLLYSKIDGEETCSVTSVQTERNQKYSGLNCVESEIEAAGYWISTFGSTHHVPAFWMKYASKVLGVQTASNIGDYFANLFYGYY